MLVKSSFSKGWKKETFQIAVQLARLLWFIDNNNKRLPSSAAVRPAPTEEFLQPNCHWSSRWELVETPFMAVPASFTRRSGPFDIIICWPAPFPTEQSPDEYFFAANISEKNLSGGGRAVCGFQCYIVRVKYTRRIEGDILWIQPRG